MGHYSKDLGSTKDMISFAYTAIPKPDLRQKAEEILRHRNYNKVGETNGNSTYEFGNRTMRILMGAFVRYFKFHVVINDIDTDTLELRIVRATTGISGGVIGINQVTTEMTELSIALKQL